MEKSLFARENRALVALLRETRQRAGLTQVEAASRLGETQSWLSKVERGAQRIDVLQLRTLCRTFGTTLPEFVSRFEELLKSRPRG